MGLSQPGWGAGLPSSGNLTLPAPLVVRHDPWSLLHTKEEEEAC